MLPEPIQHTFQIDGERYTLREWTRGGERRIRLEYAMAIAAAPTVIEPLDGASLYTEAVARVCLTEAPEIFWETQPAAASTNGAQVRVVTFEAVPRRLWEAFRKEVDAFLGLIFPPLSEESPGPSAAGADEPPAMALVEGLSPVLRGRAE
jgi:hypothetical protein